MFSHFLQSILRRLRSSSWVRHLQRKYGANFDLFLRTVVLERGRGDYPEFEHACLYAYRYMGMHREALAEVLRTRSKEIEPPGDHDVVLDFGCGPATSLFAFEEVTDGFLPVAAYVGIEQSSSMRELAGVALRALGQRRSTIEESAEPAAMVCSKLVRETPERLVLVFSYFFGQELDEENVSRVVRATKAIIRGLRPRNVVTIYANIDIESANWMPEGDIHHWYRLFMKEMGWKTRIQTASYTYPVSGDLKVDPENRTSGSLTFDIQAHEFAAHERARFCLERNSQFDAPARCGVASGLRLS